jgi:hypothetical protein
MKYLLQILMYNFIHIHLTAAAMQMTLLTAKLIIAFTFYFL